MDLTEFTERFLKHFSSISDDVKLLILFQNYFDLVKSHNITQTTELINEDTITPHRISRAVFRSVFEGKESVENLGNYFNSLRSLYSNCQILLNKHQSSLENNFALQIKKSLGKLKYKINTLRRDLLSDYEVISGERLSEWQPPLNPVESTYTKIGEGNQVVRFKDDPLLYQAIHLNNCCNIFHNQQSSYHR